MHMQHTFGSTHLIAWFGAAYLATIEKVCYSHVWQNKLLYKFWWLLMRTVQSKGKVNWNLSACHGSNISSRIFLGSSPYYENQSYQTWLIGDGKLICVLTLSTTMSEACNFCYELLKFGCCNINRGCLGWCKCFKSWVASKTYCKCHGDCEHQ